MEEDNRKHVGVVVERERERVAKYLKIYMQDNSGNRENEIVEV